MKRLLFIALMISDVFSFGQTTDTIVGWTFPDSIFSIAPYSNYGLPINLGVGILSETGTNEIIYNYSGATSYCASDTGWDGGSGAKYWQVWFFSTKNYNTLKLYSKQESTVDGPRNFKVQYTTMVPANWIDIPLTNVIDSNNWTNGELYNINLPSSCEDQDYLTLRWIMTSNISVSGSTVTSTGISRIDDIFITGVAIPNSVNTYFENHNINFSQDVSNHTLSISTNEYAKSLYIYDLPGNLVYYSEKLSNIFEVNTYEIKKSIYIIKVIFYDDSVLTRKISAF
jgi:hypothetical protein